MNADLERTIDELGPGYHDVVARLCASRELVPSARACAGIRAGVAFRRVGYLVAASLFAAIALSFLFKDAPKPVQTPFSSESAYTAAYASTKEALETIVASQNADGSWANDFLTCQNAAALRASGEERMCIAYRRAVRYLRAKGLNPLTNEELKLRECAAHLWYNFRQ